MCGHRASRREGRCCPDRSGGRNDPDPLSTVRQPGKPIRCRRPRSAQCRPAPPPSIRAQRPRTAAQAASFAPSLPAHLHEPLRRAQVIGTEPVRMQAAHRSMASTADKAGCASSHPGNWSRTTSSTDVRTHCARSIGAGASPRPGPIPRPSTTARLPSPARAHHFRLADHDRSALRPFRDPTAQHHRLHETGRLHHEPALGQTRALVFDLRRLACLPSTAAWFPRAGEQGAGVLGRAPNHLCDRQEDPA